MRKPRSPDKEERGFLGHGKLRPAGQKGCAGYLKKIIIFFAYHFFLIFRLVYNDSAAFKAIIWRLREKT